MANYSQALNSGKYLFRMSNILQHFLLYNHHLQALKEEYPILWWFLRMLHDLLKLYYKFQVYQMQGNQLHIEAQQLQV